MTDSSPLPRVSPLDREAVAKIEVGQTAVSPAVARALVAFFLTAIAIVPMIEMIGRRGTPAAATAWTRLAETPGSVRRAWTPAADVAVTPGAWNRTIVANRAALAGMAGFEDALEEESRLGRTLRPRAQVVLSGVLGAGNERVYLGRDGWLFFRTDTEYVTGGGFLDPRRLQRRVAAADEWTTPPHPDPRVAILDFHQQLEARGITLIVMPTPVKPSIHPEQFSADYEGWRDPLQNSSYAAFVDDLERAGVRVFDPAPLLTSGRAGGPQYLATDTHWRPEAMEAVAGLLAALVRQAGMAERPAPGHRIDERAVSNIGDTAAMLDLPPGQRLYPAEDAWIRRVLEADGGLWRSSRDADVLVLGDSFSNIYSLQSMGWGESAGFVEHLSFALGRPVDRIVQNDAAAFATRELLAQAGPDRLAGKRVVIWQFATRELAFGDWKVIPLP